MRKGCGGLQLAAASAAMLEWAGGVCEQRVCTRAGCRIQLHFSGVGGSDYCSSLEGDKSYSCWMAYFELKDLEKEMSREQVEKFVRQAGGVKSIINCLHLLTALSKKNGKVKEKHITSNFKAGKEEPFPVPDGIPKSQAELEEEEEAKMPDSPNTRLLRCMGKAPAWYTQAPDHETD
ncbi:hypothetical protein KSP39_PZI010723 [Platanthera zijinensis]|uniref:Uncharacterized protein n=1 Tax=Platanthera zijinensis TaxID=2320716 RepID=A0AAP0BIW3_9ASPA